MTVVQLYWLLFRAIWSGHGRDTVYVHLDGLPEGHADNWVLTEVGTTAERLTVLVGEREFRLEAVR